MAVFRATLSISADAEGVTITHNLGNASAVLVKATPTWATAVYYGTKTTNTIPVSFDVQCVPGGGNLDVEVQT